MYATILLGWPGAIVTLMIAGNPLPQTQTMTGKRRSAHARSWANVAIGDSLRLVAS